jgi:tetratricopeptide (TPR) repeat protein
MSTTRTVILLFGLTAEALAAPPSARPLFDEGKALYQAGRHLAALRRFHRAAELEPRASTQLMMARCYRKLLRPELALHHFERHLVLSALEHTGPSPHQAEVSSQIKALKELVVAVRRAEAALDAGRFAEALSLFRALPADAWPRVQRGLAHCHAGLGERDRARELTTKLTSELRSWRDAWEQRPPDQERVKAMLEELSALEARLRTPAPNPAVPSTALAPPAGARPAPVDAPRPRRRLWLVLGIGGAALALGSEALAWASYSKATSYFEHEPEYGRYRSLTIAGHVTAGVMAGAAVASFVLYHRSGRAPALAALPLRGGGLLSAAGRF